MGASVGSARGKRAAIVGINVTPMVDVVLVLLVIMMVSATYIVSQALKVELPKSASTDETVSTTLQVTVSKDDRIYVNQEPTTSDDDFRARLKAGKAGPSGDATEVNLVITADKDAKHGNVVHVMDVAKQEGITKFAINVTSE